MRGLRSRAIERGQDDGVIEHAFACPYCWESITVLVDASVADQAYVEDCEVCCNPIAIHVTVSAGFVLGFDAQPLA